MKDLSFNIYRLRNRLKITGSIYIDRKKRSCRDVVCYVSTVLPPQYEQIK